ncbi:MAG: MFS transporter [Candidatus Zixiibacteriota bacterium]|nr:MAG: MFS transporter [candidate division Zixibacteria bacterium]
MTGRNSLLKKDVVGWSLYDLANTIYSMNIVSLYLKRYLIEDLGKDDRYFDIPFSISMLLAALLLPGLGAMSDYSTKKKIFLFLFTLTCCTSVGLMAALPPTMVFGFVVLFIIANFSYEAGQPFYNSLLYSVADGKRARLVSGFGVALGYVGSIVGMAVVLPFVTGHLFSWDFPLLEAGGKAGSFLPTAILFMVFALPLFLWVREAPVTSARKVTLTQAYRDVWEGITATRKYPGVLRYLIADYFFEDSVATVIINMGLYCSLFLGFDDTDITRFLIISTISAVVGSFVIGKVAELWSLKKLLNLIVIGWASVLVVFTLVSDITVVWVLGSIVGVLLGGLWTTSRPLLAELVPRSELGRFFGLFSLSGRAAAVIGPLVWTVVVYYFHTDRMLGQSLAGLLGTRPENHAQLPYQVAILSLGLIMLVGLFIFRKVPDTRGRGHA